MSRKKKDAQQEDSSEIPEQKNLQTGSNQASAESEEDEDLLAGKFAPRLKIDPLQLEENAKHQIVNTKQRRRKLPPKNKNLEFTRNRQRIKRFVEEVHDLPRPVIYRMRGLSIAGLQKFHGKRTRVTRQIMNQKILQFHLEGENSKIENVPEESLAKTIDNYLDESKKYMHRSTRFYDQLFATAVEYEHTVKMLHFGRTLKKLSCQQKRLKFQTSWWSYQKKYRTKKRPRGYFKKPMDPVYKITDDSQIFRDHGTFYDNKPSPIHQIYRELKPRLMRRRTTNDIILDSSYFVREFFLVKSSISFRITRSSDIPHCFTPPTLRCGYFPFNAVTEKQKKHYLAERFKETQKEYLNLTYRKINPPRHFKPGKISKNELWNFHKTGKHIHGFFFVLLDTKHFHEDEDGTMIPKRYLVDMFSHQHFPLFIEYESWETRLKIAFDRVTAYNLNLSEIIRTNRPVFDSLSQNPSFLKPITLEEIIYSMEERDIQPKYYRNRSGKKEFYDFGRSRANEDYLSAFFIICGGSKLARPNKSYSLERYRVLTKNTMETLILDKKGKPFILETPFKPRGFLVHVDNFELDDRCEDLHVPRLLSVDGAETTRVISDTPMESESAKTPKPKPKKAVRERRTCMTRIQLMNVRKNIQNGAKKKAEKKKKEKKKPGRKAHTIADKALESHYFDTAYIASDIESEYEGYLQTEKMSKMLRRPKLKRSESAESFLLDIDYIDYYTNGLSVLRSRKMDFMDHSMAKRKKRKMTRKMMKHLGRYRELQKGNLVFTELMECYQGNFPEGVKAVAITKSSIRNGTYVRNNIPEIYEQGDQWILDIVFHTLKETITSIVGEEHTNARYQLGAAHLQHQTCVDRIEDNENLPISSFVPLPDPQYLAMEMLTRKRITGRRCLEEEKFNLRREVALNGKVYISLPRYRKEYIFEMAMIKRQELEFYAHWKYLVEHDMQLDKCLKLLDYDPQSLSALNQREERRRQQRQRHAQKVAALKKLLKAKVTQEEYDGTELAYIWHYEDFKIEEALKMAEAKILRGKYERNRKKAEKRLVGWAWPRRAAYQKEGKRLKDLSRLATTKMMEKRETYERKIRRIRKDDQKENEEKMLGKFKKRKI